jgi:hypothetical protein
MKQDFKVTKDNELDDKLSKVNTIERKNDPQNAITVLFTNDSI